jgi:hypothetical protein
MDRPGVTDPVRACPHTRSSDHLPASWPGDGYRVVPWAEIALALKGYVVQGISETPDGSGLELHLVDTVRPDLVVALTAGAHAAIRSG